MSVLGRIIDAAIEPFSPATVARRMAARIGLEAVRGYDAAGSNRRTKGWRAASTNADAELARARAKLADRAEDLCRNNKTAAAGARQMVAAAWGDGIAPQMRHDDKNIAKIAQDDWDRWAESKVSGQDDFYGHGKLAVRATYVRGEALTQWRPDSSGPDGLLIGMEGDFLDEAITANLDGGGRDVQGVRFNADGERTGYWLFDNHPGDYLLAANRSARLHDARHIDHVFEAQRFGQTRGVSRFAPLILTLRDIGDIEDAVLLKKKVEACLALVISPGDSGAASPLSAEQAANPVAGSPGLETLRPGMIARLGAGETATTVNPSSVGDGVEFIRHQLACVSATMVPYHVLTGDVSQANYSGLRASFLGQWAMLDDDQQNVFIPLICKPAVNRRMRRLALATGDKRFLEVRQDWTLPVRRAADPVKDLIAEIMEIRAGLKLLTKGLAERGINTEEHMAEIGKMNALIDQLQLALDTDPRRLTDSGVLQAAAPYLFKPADAPAN